MFSLNGAASDGVSARIGKTWKEFMALGRVLVEKQDLF